MNYFVLFCMSYEKNFNFEFQRGNKNDKLRFPSLYWNKCKKISTLESRYVSNYHDRHIIFLPRHIYRYSTTSSLWWQIDVKGNYKIGKISIDKRGYWWRVNIDLWKKVQNWKGLNLKNAFAIGVCCVIMHSLALSKCLQILLNIKFQINRYWMCK